MTATPARSSRTLRLLTTLLGLFMMVPFVVAASPAPRPVPATVKADAVAFAKVHDPVTNRTGEFVAAAVEEPVPAPAPEPAPFRLAPVANVELVTVSPEAEAHGFHEGSTNSLELTPLGEAVTDQRGIALPEAAADGVDYIVMASRGRATSPTSAVDIALAEGIEVASPVTGTVLDVSRYALYGKTSDVMVRIRPDSNPDVLVTVFHLVDPTVGPGDAVVAGETVIAGGPRALPFGSQIDKFVGHAGPHVHVQVDRG